MSEKISKLITVYKKYGLRRFTKKVYAYIIANYIDKISFRVVFNKKHYVKIIRNILNSNYDRVILWRSSFGYNVPLFQRPQHIANNLSKQNCLVFYEVTSMTDKVKTIKKLNENLYLFNFNNIALNKILMEELTSTNVKKYIQLYSTDWKLSVLDNQNYINKGFKFVYEYIDDINPVLTGTSRIPKNIAEKYDFVMKTIENIYVVVTAEAIKQDVVSKRGEENLVLACNGVDYNFYKDIDEKFEFDEDFKKVLKENKPIIGYYGALATWFDYELVKKLAEERKDYNIVFLGIKYDDSYDKANLEKYKNIHFLGSRNYSVLKNYAKKFNVCTIPFVINSITEATSPVKLFEYMALQKPIVTTDMNECRKYKSVMISHNEKEYIELIDKAVEISYNLEANKEYMKLLNEEALENDWSKKSEAIINLIKKDE